MTVNPISDLDYETNSTIESDNHFAYILCLISGKGGAGKTGLAINISNMSSAYRRKILLIDCDLNTTGSTVFFSLDKNTQKKLSSKSALTSQIIMNQITFNFTDDIKSKQEKSFAEKFERLMRDYSVISINDFFDFIPAGNESFLFNENDLNARNINFVESELESFFAMIRTKYDLIIMDCGAGYNALINVLNKCADRICIVLVDNEISRLATRNALSELLQNTDIKNIQCCVNMIKKDKNIQYSHIGLINEVEGFTYSEKYARLFNKGKTIEIGDSDLCIQLTNIVKKLFPAGENIASEHLSFLDNLRKKELEENEKMRKQIKRKQIKRIVITLVSVVMSLLILIIIFSATGLWEVIHPFAYFCIVVAYIFVVILGCGFTKRIKEFFKNMS